MISFAGGAGCRAGAAPGRLLGPEWLARWRRSASRFPAGVPEGEQAAFAGRIEGHAQFAGVVIVG